MSKLTEQLAMVIGVQSALGTVNADVAAATIIANTDDGLALSAGEALGLLFRKGTLTLDFARIEDEPEIFVGTFSNLPGSFLRSEVASFKFDVTIKGGGLALDGTPSAGDYNLQGAVEAYLAGFGLVRGTPTTADTPYTLDEAAYVSFKVWRGTVSYTIMDCLVTSIAYKLTPGQTVVATITVSAGGITKADGVTFPTSVSYGLQESLPAPVLKLAGAAIGAVTRGFLAGTLELALVSEETPDSNATEGVIDEQSGRKITWDGDFYVDSTDPDQDYVNLIRTGSFEDLSFTLGVHVVTGQANALGFGMQNVDFTEVKVKFQAGKVVYTLVGYATSPGAGNDEFILTSK